jgi:phage I-like protein
MPTRVRHGQSRPPAVYRQVVTLAEAVAEMEPATEDDEPVRSEIQIARTGIWFHPWYGEMVIADETLQNFVDHFYAGTTGYDLSVDQEHEPSGGAAGWFRELSKRGDQLWAEIEWTPLGAQLLRDQVYRYFSIEYATVHQDDETGVKTPNVLQGGALTNRPYIKGMAPVMLFEPEAGLAFWPQQEGSPVETITLSEELRTRLGLDSAEITVDQLQEAIDAALEAADADDDADGGEPDPEPAPETRELTEESVRLLDASNRRLTEENRQLTQRVTALETTNRETRWASYRDGKIREGRLTMALSEQFEALYMAEPERATAIIDAMPQLIDLGEHGSGGTGEHDDDPASRMLSEVRKHQAENSGVTFEAALKAVQLAQPDLAKAYTSHVRQVTHR